MKSTLKDLPLEADLPEIKLRLAEWGDMAVENGEVLKDMDPTSLFEGLPGNRCTISVSTCLPQKPLPTRL